MPSITLRGVSIKGDSKVQYTEAVAAAQSDAQAALNQEQVPKAYRNSVRDYFDDKRWNAAVAFGVTALAGEQADIVLVTRTPAVGEVRSL